MKRFLVPALAAGVLALGAGLLVPAQSASSAETVVVKRVKGVCYDRAGRRVSCGAHYRASKRMHQYRAPRTGTDTDMSKPPRRRDSGDME